MTISEYIRDFNSEFIRFVASTAKSKSIHKILDAACELCSTLPNVLMCRIYKFEKRDPSPTLIAHAGVMHNLPANKVVPLELKMPALEKLKHGEEIIEDAEITIPLCGYRGLYGVLNVQFNKPITPDLVTDALNPVSQFVSKIITDFETTSDLRDKLAKTDRIIQQKETQVEKKTLLAAEANHRVRNNLQIIHSMLINRIDEFKIYGDEAEITIRKIAGRIMAMAQVYDQLLVSGDKDIIQGDIYLNALLDDLIRIYGAQYPHIRVFRDIHSVQIKLSQASVIGIVLIELVTNAFIHAFPQSSGNIMVGLTKEAGRRHAVLVVKDNGKGLDPSANNHRNGVRLVERLIEHINGRLTILNDMGTTFLLNFKP